MSAKREWQDVAEVLGDIPLQKVLQLVCGAKRSAQDVCHLLASTKQLRSATQQHCAGLVPVKPPVFACLQRARDFAAWLSHNAGLVSTIYIEFDYMPGTWATTPQVAEDDRKAAASAIGVALETAAAAKNGASHISSCRLVNISAEWASILRHLPGSMLTELELTCSTRNGIAAALAHLQQLKKLRLEHNWCGPLKESCMDVLLQPLSAMTRLTLLNVGPISSDMPLQHLPPSLEELCCLTIYDGSQLRLGHVTALTRLDIVDTVMAGNVIFPLSLLQLSLEDVADVACLLPLTNLQALSFNRIMRMNAAADNLRQLSALTSLQRVDMAYWYGSDVDAAAAAWRHMPLHELSFHSSNLNATTIGHLGALSQLTSLTLDTTFLRNAGWESLPQALSQMTALQTLRLIKVRAQVNGNLDFDAVALSASKLVNLVYLDIRHQHISLAAATCLARIPQLRDLCLVDCGLCNSALIEVLLSQQYLTSLDVSKNSGITNAVLPVLSSMEHLTGCDLSQTSVTEEGMHHYMSHIKHCTVTLG